MGSDSLPVNLTVILPLSSTMLWILAPPSNSLYKGVILRAIDTYIINIIQLLLSEGSTQTVQYFRRNPRHVIVTIRDNTDYIH